MKSFKRLRSAYKVVEQEAAKSYEDNKPEGDPKREASAKASPAITEETNSRVTWALSAISWASERSKF